MKGGSGNARMLDVQRHLITYSKHILDLRLRVAWSQNPMLLRHPDNRPLGPVSNIPIARHCARLLRQRNRARIDERLVPLRIHTAHLSKDADSLSRLADQTRRYLLQIIGWIVP